MENFKNQRINEILNQIEILHKELRDIQKICQHDFEITHIMKPDKIDILSYPDMTDKLFLNCVKCGYTKNIRYAESGISYRPSNKGVWIFDNGNMFLEENAIINKNSYCSGSNINYSSSRYNNEIMGFSDPDLSDSLSKDAIIGEISPTKKI